MTHELDAYIKRLRNLADTPHSHQLTHKEITSINAGISALMIIRDGNYQLALSDQ